MTYSITYLRSLNKYLLWIDGKVKRKYTTYAAAERAAKKLGATPKVYSDSDR